MNANATRKRCELQHAGDPGFSGTVLPVALQLQKNLTPAHAPEKLDSRMRVTRITDTQCDTTTNDSKPGIKEQRKTEYQPQQIPFGCEITF